MRIYVVEQCKKNGMPYKNRVFFDGSFTSKRAASKACKWNASESWGRGHAYRVVAFVEKGGE